MEAVAIPPDAFNDIIAELQRRPLLSNKERKLAGVGQSQCFGLVNKRTQSCDYSRMCWGRPYLYKLLMEFGEKYCPFAYTSITINQNYMVKPHRDKGNKGNSLLVAFGNFTGGLLRVSDGPLKGDIDVRTPLIANFSEMTHEVLPFEGERYSLVFYNIADKFYRDKEAPPPPSVVQVGKKYFFQRGDVIIKDGLPHPLKGKTQRVTKIEEPVTVSFD